MSTVPADTATAATLSGRVAAINIANMAVGLAGGIPVGGSVSGTALVRSCGAQSRWANIFTGLFGLVVVLLFAPLVELIPLAALAGLLVTACTAPKGPGPQEATFPPGQRIARGEQVALEAVVDIPPNSMLLAYEAIEGSSLDGVDADDLQKNSRFGLALGMAVAAAAVRIVGARAQVVNGTNYEVTFKLDNGQTWNAVVHRSLAGDFSIIKEASRN